jgi:hypothetical protein
VRDWQLLFSGNKASAQDLASELKAEGLRCFVNDRQGHIVTHSGSRAAFSVVLVPHSEVERARFGAEGAA